MTLPAVYFVFILYYNVRQKANSKQFLIQVRVVKKGRQLRTSTMHLAQERLMNIQCSGGSRSFAKAMIALKMRIVVAGHGKLNNDQLRAIIEADPLMTI